MASKMSVRQRRLCSTANTANGEVRRRDVIPLLPRRQRLLGRVRRRLHRRGLADCQDNRLGMRDHHVNRSGDLMTGRCISTTEVPADGGMRLHRRGQIGRVCHGGGRLCHPQRIRQTGRRTLGPLRFSFRKPGSTSYVYGDSAGQGTCIYVIDTGLDDNHPILYDFGGRAIQITSFIGETVDSYGHGTHVAGTNGSNTLVSLSRP
ncbi:Subtilisin-like serine protease [Tolypocladium paradoxum]|uniref:Subtilisin-like serine protease n=1 Tax=Tolypocladium paradoxum TaxID=94208 RepID=A0A2S4KXM8_9HYPO|nr:Subtilisin-like serine protease [Tolypocladium paradoxum]